jgi:hypothetical protein
VLAPSIESRCAGSGVLFKGDPTFSVTWRTARPIPDQRASSKLAMMAVAVGLRPEPGRKHEELLHRMW